jgi:hypothetical protein
MSPDHRPVDHSDPTDPGSSQPAGGTASPRELRQRLLDLAHDVSSYLRHHHQRAVRAAAAVLLSASLAACNPLSMGTVPSLPQAATPLQQEVRTGLPTGPGRFPVDPATLGRDAQGVYHFNWLPPGAAPESGGGTPASVSLLQLAEDQTNELEVPAQGDPILHLRNDTPIPLVGSADEIASASTGSGSSSSSSDSSHRSGPGVMWFPFPIGGGTFSSPSYRNPPTTMQSDGTARGSTATQTAPPPASRTSGLPYAVSGQSGGTGSGSAATSRSGGSGGFLGGQSGGTGSGTAATGKSGASSSSDSGGVSGARSGGFSGGVGGGSSSSSS